LRYEFPKAITIEEVRAAVANANARAAGKLSIGGVDVTNAFQIYQNGDVVKSPSVFIEADRADHVIFNYIISYDGAFPSPNTGDAALDREYAILRECRGLIFHKASGHILSRRYQKFFNVNQKPETQVGIIDWEYPHVILEKLDGSMITPVYFGDDPDKISGEDLRWCTKMGVTDVATPVEAWVAKNMHYARWVVGAMCSGWTPIFEWCSRKQKIVIDYPVDRLVLTAMRNNKTGEYLSYEQLLHAALSGIDVVRALPGSVENVETFMADARALTGEEGYVIRFHDGHMVKVKGEEYCQIHGTKELLQHEKDVVSLIAYDRLDDAKAFMTDDDRERVDAFHTAYETGVEATSAELASIVADVLKTAGDDPKAFAQALMSTKYPAEYQSMLFRVKAGADASGEIRKVIAKFAHPTAGTQSRIDAIRHLFGGLRWVDYRDPTYVEEAD
jgi:RNA ligase